MYFNRAAVVFQSTYVSQGVVDIMGRPLLDARDRRNFVTVLNKFKETSNCRIYTCSGCYTKADYTVVGAVLER